METDHQTTVVEIDDFVTFRRAGKIWSGVKNNLKWRRGLRE